mmetsp:Transcript_26762/g.63275  ORF Transcript_26762/g.63275 Transcript_26762/m.63275 type:complete len:295 (-) Transcript_26762:691-1575(-)
MLRGVPARRHLGQRTRYLGGPHDDHAGPRYHVGADVRRIPLPHAGVLGEAPVQKEHGPRAQPPRLQRAVHRRAQLRDVHRRPQQCGDPLRDGPVPVARRLDARRRRPIRQGRPRPVLPQDNGGGREERLHVPNSRCRVARAAVHSTLLHLSPRQHPPRQLNPAVREPAEQPEQPEGPRYPNQALHGHPGRPRNLSGRRQRRLVGRRFRCLPPVDGIHCQAAEQCHGRRAARRPRRMPKFDACKAGIRSPTCRLPNQWRHSGLCASEPKQWSGLHGSHLQRRAEAEAKETGRHGR